MIHCPICDCLIACKHAAFEDYLECRHCKRTWVLRDKDPIGLEALDEPELGFTD
jgi:hypothetical protein